MELIDLLARLDVLEHIEGFLSAFRYADWRKARKRGAWGIAREIIASITGDNAPTLTVRRGALAGTDAEALLRRHGIPLFGRWFTGRDLTFRVPRRQARLAQWLLDAKIERGYEPPVTRMPRRRKRWE